MGTSSRIRVARAAILACLAGVVVAVAAPASAPAADVCAGHPSDPSVVCVRDNDRTVDVCDRDPDGHRAYARVVTQATYPAYQSPYYDDNDSKPGCANLTFPSKVVSVAVCVQHEGCSAQKATGVPPPAPPAPSPPPAPAPTPAPAPAPTPAPAPQPAPPAPVGGGSVELGVGLGCIPPGQRIHVSLAVHRRRGRARPRVRRVVFYYRKSKRRSARHAVVARTDRRAPYRRSMPVDLGAGNHRVYARVYYQRAGRSKLGRHTVSRGFAVCA